MLVILSHSRKFVWSVCQGEREELLPQLLEQTRQVLPWTNKSEATESTYLLRGFSCLKK